MTVQRHLRKHRLAVSIAASPVVIAGLLLPAASAGARAATAPPGQAPAALTGAPAPLVHRAGPSTAGPFATLLFSRTEMTAADGCARDDSGIARLDTTVAPYLKALRMIGTGTLVTDSTRKLTETCTHASSSLTASWADATALAQGYGWNFVSHTASYPAASKWASMTKAQQRAETCGSAQTITNHGLPGANGLIAYPGTGNNVPASVQGTFGAKCFAWGRLYSHGHGITSYTAATTPPYWQETEAVNGGSCNDSAAGCYSVPQLTGDDRYVLPSKVIAQIDALKPGQWLTVQSYILVTGKNPAYGTSKDRWDCTSANPADHWTNDNERYCYSDWQQIVQALAAKGITVTDPLTAGVAFGRPATFQRAAP